LSVFGTLDVKGNHVVCVCVTERDRERIVLFNDSLG